jgi:hypothetical protein
MDQTGLYGLDRTSSIPPTGQSPSGTKQQQGGADQGKRPHRCYNVFIKHHVYARCTVPDYFLPRLARTRLIHTHKVYIGKRSLPWRVWHERRGKKDQYRIIGLKLCQFIMHCLPLCLICLCSYSIRLRFRVLAT